MVSTIEIKNLTYNRFHKMNFNFKKGTFYSIAGCNNSGKTTLFKVLSGFYFTDGMIICNNIMLNKKNRYAYLQNIGVVARENKNSFFYKRVIDELEYPLINLKYSKKDRLLRIKKVLSLFNLNNVINKNINDLTSFEKQKLLFAISLLHIPKVLLIDDALELLKRKEKKEIMNILKKIKDSGLTIIYFTSNLENCLYSDYIILLSDYKIIKETTVDEMFDNDKLFLDNNLELPFMYDLSNKLKIYGVIDKNYFNMKDMVNDIWP